MVDLKEQGQLPQEEELQTETLPNPTTELAAAETPAAPAAKKLGLKGRWKAIPRKKRRRVIRILVLLVVILLAVALGIHFLGNQKDEETKVLTDVVEYGAITSKIENSGLTKAVKNESLTVTTPGTLLEVFVTEGQQVTEGDPLFVVDSPTARSAVDKARNTVQGIQKQISAAQKDLAGLNLSPSYAGKLLEVETLNPGDSISKGQKVATLADDSKLRLEQYYSYAYSGDIHKGQTVQVSVPSLMSTVTGTVEAVHMVSRITPQGSKLFSAEIVVKNPGSLSAGMDATATVNVKGETVYPYEPGKLAYNRTGDLCSTVDGKVISSRLVDYLQVKPGEVLVKIDGEESEGQLFELQQQMETAQEELVKAEKNLANCSAKAPISGTVIGLTLAPGDEIDTQNPILTISDTTKLLINADVDERHINLIKVGDLVDLNQNENMGSGTVQSVSLSSKVDNGTARYPIVIAVDNAEGIFQVNSHIQYSVIAGENDNCLTLPIQCVRNAATEEGEAVSVVYVAGEKPKNALENVVADEEIPEGYWAVPVEIGLQDGVRAEIKSGVKEGMEVFTQIQTTEAWG